MYRKKSVQIVLKQRKVVGLLFVSLGAYPSCLTGEFSQWKTNYPIGQDGCVPGLTNGSLTTSLRASVAVEILDLTLHQNFLTSCVLIRSQSPVRESVSEFLIKHVLWLDVAWVLRNVKEKCWNCFTNECTYVAIVITGAFASVIKNVLCAASVRRRIERHSTAGELKFPFIPCLFSQESREECNYQVDAGNRASVLGYLDTRLVRSCRRDPTRLCRPSRRSPVHLREVISYFIWRGHGRTTLQVSRLLFRKLLLFQALLRGALTQQSAVILVCMAIDRYVCMLHPHRYHKHSSKRVSYFALYAHTH